MANLHQSIEVSVPVQAAYNQWTQFEDWPSFMDAIEEVRQVDDRHLHWRAEFGGVEREWDTEITEQIPDLRIAWRSVGGPENSGAVSFEPLGTDRTRIVVDVEYRPETVTEETEEMLGMVSTNLESDLENFRDFVESRGA